MSVGIKRAKAKQGATLDHTSWQPLTWRPGIDRLYRCEIDPGGTERWFLKVIRTESELMSQSDVARLIGVSRQAIRSAVVYERLGTVNCNGRRMVHRAEVLALQIDPKRGRARKQSRRT
jgi:hypothetical protein